MVKCKVKGREYELRLDLDALETLEGVFEGENVMEVFRKRSFSNVKKIFVALANCARDYNGQPQDVTEKDVKHASMADAAAMADAILAAQEEAFKTETVNGAADDSHHDEVMEMIEEIEEKNGEPGEG